MHLTYIKCLYTNSENLYESMTIFFLNKASNVLENNKTNNNYNKKIQLYIFIQKTNLFYELIN